MRVFKADLHLHTVLSPCGSLEMSPTALVARAKEVGLDLIAITDHNTTLHCELVQELAREVGIATILGAEVTTKEEVHCLTFFPTLEILSIFQLYLEQNYPIGQRNNPALFGYQVVVDRDENIIKEVDAPLISALTVSIGSLEKEVHRLGGLFIPAHINKTKFSIISQLGFIPADLPIDGVEISKHTSKKEFLGRNGYLKKYPFLQNSDAHFVQGIGEVYTSLMVEEPSFDELKLALKGAGGRSVMVD
ncbi:MAG TPA: PHP domain-containing protein [Williamwhitmania sp.]|nr:PHP domain-containing protein [Williamwhitmania sp.]